MEESPWLIPPEPRSKPNPARRHAAHLTTLFEHFIAFMSVEKGARPKTISTYRYCFGDFLRFAQGQTNSPLLASQFSTELVKTYQYELAHRGLSPNTIRSRLSVLAAFAKWTVQQDKLEKNPFDRITRPARRFKLPETLRWEIVLSLIQKCQSPRDKALLALMAYGGLRRSEVVALDVGDFDARFGLRRVLGKGGSEAAVPLGNDARAIVSDYLARERPSAGLSEPLFVVFYQQLGRRRTTGRMHSNRVYKIVQTIGKANGIPNLHPHALRHACAVELLRRTNNIAAVQQHLRHADVTTTTVYARLLPHDLVEVAKLFDIK